MTSANEVKTGVLLAQHHIQPLVSPRDEQHATNVGRDLTEPDGSRPACPDADDIHLALPISEEPVVGHNLAADDVPQVSPTRLSPMSTSDRLEARA